MSAAYDHDLCTLIHLTRGGEKTMCLMPPSIFLRLWRVHFLPYTDTIHTNTKPQMKLVHVFVVFLQPPSGCKMGSLKDFHGTFESPYVERFTPQISNGAGLAEPGTQKSPKLVCAYLKTHRAAVHPGEVIDKKYSGIGAMPDLLRTPKAHTYVFRPAFIIIKGLRKHPNR